MSRDHSAVAGRGREREERKADEQDPLYWLCASSRECTTCPACASTGDCVRVPSGLADSCDHTTCHTRRLPTRAARDHATCHTSHVPGNFTGPLRHCHVSHPWSSRGCFREAPSSAALLEVLSGCLPRVLPGTPRGPSVTLPRVAAVDYPHPRTSRGSAELPCEREYAMRHSPRTAQRGGRGGSVRAGREEERRWAGLKQDMG